MRLLPKNKLISLQEKRPCWTAMKCYEKESAKGVSKSEGFSMTFLHTLGGLFFDFFPHTMHFAKISEIMIIDCDLDTLQVSNMQVSCVSNVW
jgi:hypothetical protein